MSDPNLIEQLADEIVEAVQDANPSLARLEKLLQDVKDMLAQPYYRQQPLDQQILLQDARNDLETKIKELRSKDGGGLGGDEIGGSGGVDGSTDGAEEQAPAELLHEPNADDWMNKAEIAFYAGQYNEAINFYNEVLKIEPTWERARQHKAQAQVQLFSENVPG
jgi:tetratricopeptide (TPR) repeat protein